MSVKKLALALMTTATLMPFHYAQASLPVKYQEFKAEEKLDHLWQQVESSAWKSLPSLSEKRWRSIFSSMCTLMKLKVSFDHTSDEIPVGRKKIIHTYGSVAKFSFIPSQEHPYTGLYLSEAKGLIRLSLAKNPVGDSFIPGMAIKFLIDGQPSRNLHVMHSLEGQGDNWNFFAKDFSNRIAPPKTMALKVINAIFETARKPSTNLPVDHLARIYAHGTSVEHPVYPERLIFRPTTEVKTMISADSREDFRISLQRVPAGTSLYEVYGVSDGLESYIGAMKMESSFVASSYGDLELFFQHQR